MKYVQSTELAIDSLFYMAAHPELTDFSVEQVAQAQRVSPSYLAKVFQQLVRAGLLRSHRGAKGGYMLGRAPDQISLLDIAVVFEGNSPLYACNSTVKQCFAGSKCVILETFMEAEKKMNGVLAGVTLQDVVNRVGPPAGWIGPQSRNGASEVQPAAVSADNGNRGGLVVPATTPLDQLLASRAEA